MPGLLPRLLVVLLSLMLGLVGGCKKTVEGEESAYKSNVSKITALKAEYPGFKTPLDARLDKAKGLYEEASSLSDQAKVDKLTEANGALGGGFVTDLGTMERKIEELRKKRVEAASKAGDKSSRLGAKVAAEDAKKTLDRVDTRLKEGAQDEAGAKAVVAKLTKDIKTSLDAVNKVLEVDKEKKDAKEQKADAKADAEAKEKAAAEAKVADWKCEYCGSTNKHDKTSCESCGAPRAK